MNYQAHVELLLEVIEKSKHDLDATEHELKYPTLCSANRFYFKVKKSYYDGYTQGLDKAFYWLTGQWSWKFQDGWEVDD